MYLLVHQSNSPAALRAGNRCPRFRFLGTQIVSCITGRLFFSSPYFWATRTNSSVQKEGAEELAVLIISCSVLAFDYFLGEKLLLLITLFGLTCSEHDCIKGTIVSLSGLVCRLRWCHTSARFFVNNSISVHFDVDWGFGIGLAHCIHKSPVFC